MEILGLRVVVTGMNLLMKARYVESGSCAAGNDPICDTYL